MEKTSIKEMMEFANEVLQCTEEVVVFAKEKGYDPYVFQCSIESIYKLLKEKEMETNK